MTAAHSQDKPPLRILAIAGMLLGYGVFLAGMWVGMSIDPNVDMPARLLAYNAALAGLTTAFACRWAMSEGRIERILWGTISFLALGLTVFYALFMH